MRKNMGTGTKIKFAKEAYMLKISWRKPGSPPQKKNIPNKLINRKEKATGKTEANNINRLPKIKTRAHHQSNFVYPL